MATTDGKKTGGRSRGTPNKKTIELSEKIRKFCKERGYQEYDPVLQMVDVAHDDKADIGIKLQAAKEVAQYLYPKRKAMEIDIDPKELVKFIIERGD